jgi:hypothetical protein
VAAIFNRQRSDLFKEQDVASTQAARQYKDATDLVCQSNENDGVSALGLTLDLKRKAQIKESITMKSADCPYKHILKRT